MTRNFILLIILFSIIYSCKKEKIEGIPQNDFIDIRDGHLYKVTNINGQIWMAENFAYDLGHDCWIYDNENQDSIDDILQKFGRLYTYSAAYEACPEGWHLPSINEYDKLLNSVSDFEALCTYWGNNYELNENINTTGFSAEPGGYSVSYPALRKFYGLSQVGYFMTSCPDIVLKIKQEEAVSAYFLTTYETEDAYSVRYIKD